MKTVCESKHEIMDINKKLGWFVKKNWDAFDDDKTFVEPAIAPEDISDEVPLTIDFMDDALLDPQDPTAMDNFVDDRGEPPLPMYPTAMDNFVDDRGEPPLAMYGPDPEPQPPPVAYAMEDQPVIA